MEQHPFETAISGILAVRGASLAEISTFRIGGPADWLLSPCDRGELLRCFAAAREAGLPYLLIGNGSNVLFDDAGFRGVVILTGGLRSLTREGNTLTADCGVPLTLLARTAADAGLGGFEFAYGIPGSVGGAVVMNAGAYGGQISDALCFSEYADTRTGQITRLPAADHRYGYRESVYLCDPGLAVLSACFALTPGDPGAIRAKCEDNMRARSEKQPLNLPSAGSVFKRPPGQFAGRLIEEAGLKGARVGGAQVSEKHAGFIVNRGGATARDVLALIERIREEVRRRTGTELVPEIRRIPEKP